MASDVRDERRTLELRLIAEKSRKRRSAEQIAAGFNKAMRRKGGAFWAVVLPVPGKRDGGS